MATVFVSPGVYTREQDFSQFASRIGVTKLGMVGETLKGPAFEPTKVRSTDEYLFRFGGTDTRLQLPYAANTFLSQSNELTITRILGNEGCTNSAAWIIKADSSSTLSGTTLAVIRSKMNDSLTAFLATASTDIQITNYTGLLSAFTLSFTNGALSAFTDHLVVSLDETRTDYIENVIGTNSHKKDGDFGIYVERIYPHMIRQAFQTGEIAGFDTSITFTTNSAYTNYLAGYTNPMTPYVVSTVNGNKVRDLFRFQSISDGNSANKEVKISIGNIDEINKTFDVIVRKYNDTDATASSSSLERFRNVTMDPSLSNYIAKVIGTTNEEFPRKSLFITLDMASNHPTDAIPGGFRGYSVRGGAIAGTPKLYYKQSYLSADTTFKTFLGISELGYTYLTSSAVGSRNGVQTIEDDMFVYMGADTTASEFGLTQGFHMEAAASAVTASTFSSYANSQEFVVGNKATITGYAKTERKFTLVPAGGWDGFSIFRYPDYTTAAIDVNDVASIKQGIDTFADPESVDINLFAVPGVNFSDHTSIVRYALDMVENRADSLYIVDAPRLYDESTQIKGTALQITTELQDANLNSSYAATYWPWIQMQDLTLNKNVYVAPTGEVVRAIAKTDNQKNVWFAPAGFSRGTLSNNILRADLKLKVSDRDILYNENVNPIATLTEQGIVIWGQKTLQIQQSSLTRVNVRRLLLQVRRLISAAASSLLFEQNNASTRDQFIAKVEPILLDIQNKQGLNAYQIIITDVANESVPNTLTGVIKLKPTESLEFVDLTFQVLPNSGANFNEF